MKSEASAPVVERQRRVVEAAQAEGLLAGENRTVGARVPHELLERAKQRSGISSTTDLVEYALAKVAIEDDFGPRLVARKGTMPPDVTFDV